MTVSNAAGTTTTAVDDEIPTTYKELHTKYAGFVASALRKHNKVGRNFEELNSYIWKRLIEKDILKLFRESLTNKLPRNVSALQACDYLGISWDTWRKAQWAYHCGEAIKSHRDPNRIIGYRLGHWMPLPNDWKECESRARRTNGLLIEKGYAPRLVSYGCHRPDAMYLSDEIVRLSKMGFFENPAESKLPEVKPTKAHFQAYLSKSVFSDFSNWCRTYARKWSQDRPMYIRDGADESEANWENELVDPTGTFQETRALAKECVTRLSKTLHESMQGTDVVQCKPVEQTEIQMYALLERGVPLSETVRKLDIPDRVRRSLLKSIADFRTRAAQV
jgi:hypothetical protein